MQPRWVQTPTTISHCGFCTRAESACGSGRVDTIDVLGGFVDFLGRAVADEHRLAAPFDRDDLAFGNGADIDFGRGHGQRRGVGAHLVDERPDDRGGSDGGDGPRGDIQKISAGRFDRRCGGQVLRPQSVSARPEPCGAGGSLRRLPAKLLTLHAHPADPGARAAKNTDPPLPRAQTRRDGRNGGILAEPVQTSAVIWHRSAALSIVRLNRKA